MKTFLLGTLIGVIAGGALVFYLFVGVPRAAQLPGRPIQPPDGEMAAGTAQVVLREQFFNEVVGAIFRDMNDPTFPLNGSAPACDSRLTILPDGSGATTALRFENNRIAAPLAFSGGYNSPFGCLQFQGWAQAYLELRYDAATQAVLGQINVETVNLDGVNPILSGFVTPIVQT